MKAQLIKILSVLLVLGIWGTAVADSTVRLVWMCSVNDGKTMDDVRASNSAWVKFMRAEVDKAIETEMESSRAYFEGGFDTLDEATDAVIEELKAYCKREAPQMFPKETTTEKTGRNDPCPCGSGKKFKKCCGG